MIQEILLIFSCASNTACEQTRYTYLHYNSAIQQYIYNAEENVNKKIPKNYFVRSVPIIASVVKGEFKLPLTKNITIAYNKKDELLSTKLVYGLEY